MFAVIIKGVEILDRPKLALDHGEEGQKG